MNGLPIHFLRAKRQNVVRRAPPGFPSGKDSSKKHCSVPLRQGRAAITKRRQAGVRYQSESACVQVNANTMHKAATSDQKMIVLG